MRPCSAIGSRALAALLVACGSSNTASDPLLDQTPLVVLADAWLVGAHTEDTIVLDPERITMAGLEPPISVAGDRVADARIILIG